MARIVKDSSLKSYVAALPFNTDIFKYTVTQNPSTFRVTGTLSAVPGATAGNCPVGRVLRENGKKLYPGANPGISTLMVGVFDNQSMLSGFIDPNSPKFAVYSTDRPAYLKDGVDPVGGLTDQGPPVYTNGVVTADGGQVRSSNVVNLTAGAATVTLDVSLGQVFKLFTTVPAITINATNLLPGAQVFIILTHDSTSDSHVVTFGTNMWGTGTRSASTGQVYTISYICDGNALYEISRSSNSATPFTDTT